MRKHSDWHRTKGFPVQSLFMAGLVIGIVLPDILWRMEWHQQTLSTMYLLRTFAAGSEDQTEYLLQVVKMRGSVYLLGMGCGISVFGVPFAVAGSVYLGMKLGLLLTMSVLQFGLQGGLVGAGLLFPQYLFYIPSVFYLCDQSYRQSMKIWKNKGMITGSVSRYFLQDILCGIFYLLGMLTEVYCNPIVLEWLLEKVGIF